MTTDRFDPLMQKLHAQIDASADAALDAFVSRSATARKALGLRHIILVRNGMSLRLPPRFTCPECGGRLAVEVDEWSDRTGIPSAGGFRVFCIDEETAQLAAWSRDEDLDEHLEHRYWQSDWGKLEHAVGKFLVRRVRVRY